MNAQLMALLARYAPSAKCQGRAARLIPVLLVTLALAPCASADWINLTGAETAPNIAEIYVNDDHVRVALEMYVGDLEHFIDLVPDDWLRDAGRARAPLQERLRRFSTDVLRLETGDGELLVARSAEVEPRMRKDRQSPFAGMIDPRTRRRAPEPPADRRVLYAELIYPFSGRPGVLTISPPLDVEARARVNIGFITYHKSVPVIDFRYLGATARLSLDWADPWYSKFNDSNLRRHHESPMTSFLYVEPYEVRHELLVRVRDLGRWMDLGLRGAEHIEVDELETLRERVGQFLLERNPVRVDGRALPPLLDRTAFVTVGLGGIRILERPQRLEIATAIMGVILAYPVRGLPDEVTVDWELFTDQIQRVPATATDPAGPLGTFLTPDSNVHRWTNHLKTYVPPGVAAVAPDDTVTHVRVPLLSALGLLAALGMMFWTVLRYRARRPVWRHAVAATVALAASAVLAPLHSIVLARPALLSPALSDAEVRDVLESVLRNAYRAFDFRDEAVVYDKLALTVAGDLLADVYLQSRRSLLVEQAGGAQAKVREVAVEEATVRPRDGGAGEFAVDATWTALGTVGHWGHVHVRRNLYRGRLSLGVVEGAWKLTRLELIEEQRLEPRSRARGGGSAGQQ